MQLTTTNVRTFLDDPLVWIRQKQKQRRREKNAERFMAIAAKYGYLPGSEEVKAAPWVIEDMLNDKFDKKEWRRVFNPADPSHVEWHGNVLKIMGYPTMITMIAKNCGASRADIARANLSKGWEQSCDRIVIDSHETTFFKEDAPVVIFYGSGRDGWGRVANAVDALRTQAGIVIDEEDVFVENDPFRRIPDLVIKRVGGAWPSFDHRAAQ